MNKDEQEAFYIACCLCCTLSERMKDCKVCQFNIGLVAKQLKTIKAAPVEYPQTLKQARIQTLVLMLR